MKNIEVLRTAPADVAGARKQQYAAPEWFYEDPDFAGEDSLYWGGEFSRDPGAAEFREKLASGEYWFDRWPNQFPPAPVFGAFGSPRFTEPLTGDHGTHHLLAAASAIAEYPELIRDAFITEEANDAGIL